jgi:hypothetical protein
MSMKQNNQSRLDDRPRPVQTLISRRAAVGSSALAVVGMLSGSVFGQERREPRPEVQERREQSRAFFDRMRTAGPEEMQKIMEEQAAQHRTRAVENLKGQLGVSEEEWAVVRPRVEAVYNLVHPQPQLGRGDMQPAGPVEQRTRELREVLADKGAKPEEIKAKLTALRAAKEQARQDLVKARQDLRQLMTLRQEAVLVLNGLLD